MPPTRTTNFGLLKPEVGKDNNQWGDTLNQTLDQIDNVIATTPGPPGPAGAVATVTDKIARDITFPPTTAPIGTVVGNIAARRLERLREDRNYDEFTGTPTGHINSDTFALGSWYDANGVKQFHDGTVHWLTPLDITAGQPSWRGKYFAYADTRDDVLLNEMLLEAHAPDTVKGGNGDIVWTVGNSKTRPCWIQGISWMTARSMFIADVSGSDIRGMLPQATTITQISRDTSGFMTDGYVAGIMENLAYTRQPDRMIGGVPAFAPSGFQHSYKPMIDLACFGTFGIAGPANQVSDMAVYNVTDSSMPHIKIAGQAWAVNAFVGQYVLIIDDPATNQAIGQVRRIIENTADTLYIAGRWDWIPSASATILINPSEWGWSSWHTATSLAWFYGKKALPVYTGQTLRHWNYQSSGSISSGTVQGTSASVQVDTSRWSWNIVINAWSAGTPNPNFGGNHNLGDNGRNSEPNDPAWHPSANFAIGGTLVAGAGNASADNDNWVAVSGGTALGADHSKIGMRVRTIAANAGIANAALAVPEAGGIVTLVGAARTPGDCVEMRLIVLTGAFAGTTRWITANTANTFTLDQIIGLQAGDTVQILDALVLGQTYPVCDSTGSNKIWTTWTNGDILQFWFWRKRPKAGDQVQLLGKYSNQLVQGGLFHRVSANAGGFGDLAWAIARTGTQSMGSECRWDGCFAFANRIGMYGDGFNILDLNWHGGGAGANIHTFYFPRGAINLHGCGFGTGNFGNQVGAHVFFGTASRSHVQMTSLYAEDFMLLATGAPLTLLHSSTFGGVLGQPSLNHTWTPGELWHPQTTQPVTAPGGGVYQVPIHKGRQFICVEIVGTGSTATSAEPATLAETAESLVEVSNGGNGARFVRMDFMAVTCGPSSTIVGGLFCLGQIKCVGDLVVAGPIVSRPDWNGSNSNFFSEDQDSNQSGSVRGTVTCKPIIVDGALGTQSAIGHFPVNFGTFASWLKHPYSTYMQGPLIWAMGHGGDIKQAGIWPIRGDSVGLTSSDRLIALVGQGDGSFGSEGGQNPPILTSIPRINAGNNVSGYDTRIGGGQGTGTGLSGGVEVLIASAGLTGPALNPYVRAARFDEQKRFVRSGGSAKMAVAGFIDIGAGGNATPNPTATEVSRYRMAGAAQFNDPTGTPIEGQSWTLEILNNTAGPITPTAGGAAIMGGFVAIGAGKWQTRRYVYDSTLTKWKPTGTWSGDL